MELISYVLEISLRRRLYFTSYLGSFDRLTIGTVLIDWGILTILFDWGGCYSFNLIDKNCFIPISSLLSCTSPYLPKYKMSNISSLHFCFFRRFHSSDTPWTRQSGKKIFHLKLFFKARRLSTANYDDGSSIRSRKRKPSLSISSTEVKVEMESASSMEYKFASNPTVPSSPSGNPPRSQKEPYKKLTHPGRICGPPCVHFDLDGTMPSVQKTGL